MQDKKARNGQYFGGQVHDVVANHRRRATSGEVLRTL
jgi:hypothetical protein